MNRFERLVRIHRLLKSLKAVPMRRFIDELEVSRTTITRDFEYLRDFLGAPIVYDRDVNGHRYDPEAPEFELPGFWLNQSELYALLAMEGLLEAVQPGILGPHLGPLKARIRRLLGESGQDAESVARQVRVLASGRRRTDSDVFSQVAHATLARRALDLVYHGRARDRVEPRRVHPQRLISYRNNWYLVGHCENAAAIRIFSLDRIRKAVTLEDAARPVDDLAVDRAVEGSYGIFSGTPADWAVLRFDSQAARWAAEESWHPDQIGNWKGEFFELQVPYSNPTELVMEVLRYGPEVEVIAPATLRETVAQRLRKAADRY